MAVTKTIPTTADIYLELNGTKIAAAAGASKAEAILSVLRHDRHALLVTDEGAARQILALLS